MLDVRRIAAEARLDDGSVRRAGARYRMLVGLDERSIGGDGLAVEVGRCSARAARITAARRPAARRSPAYPSVSPLVPAAHWDEREAKDLLGIVPLGHPDPRRLVLHERWPRGYHPLRKDVPGRRRGRRRADRHFVPVRGPRRGRLPAAGRPDPRGHHRARSLPLLGHRRAGPAPRRAPVLHPSRPREARRGPLVRGALPLVERACGVCTVTHALAYSPGGRAADAAPTSRARRAGRGVLLAELERLYNHVGDLGNICAGIGFHPGVSRLGALKERLLRLERGAHRPSLPDGLRRARRPRGTTSTPTGLAALPRRSTTIGHELAGAVRSIVRSDGVHGPTPRHRRRRARRWPRPSAPAGSPPGRAGIDTDLRRDEPYAAYGELDVSAGQRRHAATSRRASTSAPRRRTSRFGSSARRSRSCQPGPVAGPLGRSGRRRARPRWPAPKARAARRGSGCAPATTERSTGCACARRRSPTGRWSPRRCPATSCPTSRSSTRASSSATPARIADDAARRPRPPPPPAPPAAADPSRYPDAPPELPPAARGLPELDPAAATRTAACVDRLPDRAPSRSTDGTWPLDAGRVRLLRRLRAGLPAGRDPARAPGSSSRLGPRATCSSSTTIRRADRDRDAAVGRDAAGRGSTRRATAPTPSTGRLGRSLHVRHLDAGSCNGCDWEIAALLNPYHDVQRLGIDFVASPRHADLLLVTGIMTRNLEEAALRTYEAMPEPRLVVAVGACAISGGVFAGHLRRPGRHRRRAAGRRLRPGLPASPGGLIHGLLVAVGTDDRVVDAHSGLTTPHPIPANPQRPVATASASTSRSNSALSLRWAKKILRAASSNS